ncbi:hypothetical protein [Paraburkholderia youngii]|uniref:hypothetical protein n=1 Tax=Paraburkholderia youngii TaxID=2782701 RepID=UPI003D1C5F41
MTAAATGEQYMLRFAFPEFPLLTGRRFVAVVVLCLLGFFHAHAHAQAASGAALAEQARMASAVEAGVRAALAARDASEAAASEKASEQVRSYGGWGAIVAAIVMVCVAFSVLGGMLRSSMIYGVVAPNNGGCLVVVVLFIAVIAGVLVWAR